MAKITSSRLFLAMNSIHHSPLYLLDIKNAFLDGKLQKEVYMDQLSGFLASSNSRLVCKHQQSLYGLKQSPHTWFGHFNSVLIQFGMTRCETDHSVSSLMRLEFDN